MNNWPRSCYGRGALLAAVSLLFVGANSAKAQAVSGNPSFSTVSDQNLLTHDFGTLLTGSDITFNLSVTNLVTVVGDTSTLSLEIVSPIGDSTAIELLHDPISALAAGDSASFALRLHRIAAGEFSVNYLLQFTSDALPDSPAQLVTLSAFARVVLPGDVDVDGDVDGADFLAWQRGYGIASGASLEQGDANFDGAVDSADFALWKQHFGETTPTANAINAIAAPEPNAAVMVSFVVSALGHFRRRQ